ncbi:hypothetical protein LSTR_LSTR010410 [Laodelphax striatellus]|uniref:IRS-type PTB domain-containing protein n=1 Tax=Laodelphax striatellus TaxID=195883 RepID=A0A482XHN2_LAOST|nr:hypothetical protein LSTR_LSTR010410 [Laodelphax striatellus]
MGCVCSKHTDNHPSIFQVVNVDEEGQKLHDGQLEVTDTDLIVYQRQRSPVRWPLRSLRRYGFDADIFSFESGRRCPTGPGVYAFRCRRAEELFNLLQSHIQMRNSTTDDTISREFNSSSQPQQQQQRPVSCGSGSDNYLEPTPLRQNSLGRFPPAAAANGPSRIGSIGSNGPLSPISPSSPPPNYVNGGGDSDATSLRQHCRTLSRSYSSNSTCLSLAVPSETAPTLVRDHHPPPLVLTKTHQSYERTTVLQVSPTYSISSETNFSARTEECRVITATDSSDDGAAAMPFYINIKPGMHNLQSPPASAAPAPASLPPVVRPTVESDLHEYANLELGADIETMIGGCASVRKMERSLTRQSFVLPPNLANRSVVIDRQVNYAVLDLEHPPVPPSPVSLAAPSYTTPDDTQPAQRYATIDFDKTIALSNSINPSVGQESEGCRVTRHDPDHDPSRHRHPSSAADESRKSSLSRTTRGLTDRLSASLTE